MTGRAKVVSTDGRYATVMTERKSACEGCHRSAEGCAACSLLGAGGKMTCRARNDAGAKTGDTVEISSDSRRMLTYGAVIFILPIALAIAAYFIAGRFSGGEAIPAISAGAAFAAALAGAGIWSAARGRKETDVFITSVIDGEGGEPGETPGIRD
ncbi:MAG: SoxR reducing system RseC family protein [Clostridia bacterium]|nr:SoxR reducing system RseC family protein [Clostridia bacterium]